MKIGWWAWKIYYLSKLRKADYKNKVHMVESTNFTRKDQYIVPYEYRKFFSAEQTSELVQSFKNYDKDKNGVMDKNEFREALKDMGYRDLSEAKVSQVLKSVDKNQNGVIEWDEFLEMMRSCADKKQPLRRLNSRDAHAMEEISTFSRLINKKLARHEELKERLPIDPDSTEDLFNTLYDGIVGLYLLNECETDRIDMRTVNKGPNLNIFKVRQNLNMFMTGCKGLI